MLAAISAAQSLVNILIAAAISTAMLGVGLYGRRVTSGDGPSIRRGTRGLWVVAGIVASLMTLFVAWVESGYVGRNDTELVGLGLAVVVGVAFGVSLVGLGLRGRWVGDHPYCRRCGFDLFGKPPESNVCNECGTDLANPRAMTIGVRHRRLVPLLAGAFLLTTSAAIGVSLAATIASSTGRFSLTPYKPGWWLARSATTSTESQAELNVRLRNGTLDAATAESVVTGGESHAARDPAYAQFHDAFALEAWSRGKLSETAMRRTLRSAMTLQCVFPHATPTRVPFYALSQRAAGLAGGMLAVSYSATDYVVEIEGRVTPCTVGTSRLPGRFGIDGIGDVIRFDEPLPLGQMQLKLTARISVTLHVVNRPSLTESDTVALSSGVILNVQPPVAAIAPPINNVNRLWEETAANVHLSQPTTALEATMIDITFTTRGRSTFAGNVFLRERGGGERLLGEVVIHNGNGSLKSSLPPPVPEFPFEIILKPDDDLASESAWPQRLYRHPITIAAPQVMRTPRPAQ